MSMPEMSEASASYTRRLVAGSFIVSDALVARHVVQFVGVGGEGRGIVFVLVFELIGRTTVHGIVEFVLDAGETAAKLGQRLAPGARHLGQFSAVKQQRNHQDDEHLGRARTEAECDNRAAA